MGDDEMVGTSTVTDQPTETETATAAAPSERDLRVSDNEREHVVAILQKAIGQGMLDLDEFTERTDVALAARTRGELNAVLTDLPGLVHRDAATPAVLRPYGQPLAFGGVKPGQALELNAKYSSLTRSGPWVVPAALVVRNKYGTTKLDFTDARVDHAVVHIDLDAKWGSVELIIPEHAAVDVNAITDIAFGSLTDKTRSNGRTGNPRYVVSGRVHGGSLVIRHPRRGLFC